ncbi:methyltransferase domain-containing protein [Aquimarina gracilis]|uniref:Methyltransferase domain-containing protein n=1 Tax=Aquimarina gracilis TaxID=874422 RepID=A0ABU5ZPJ3_9FLAO|nr:methyltransferase domain-containing protein [Aquimarina gracilis]MEB3344031.1 methyltransferase domain-containing protein [Aquimarina gracilis]
MKQLQNRLHTPEELDNLSLSGTPLKRTLQSLKFINSVLGNHRQLGTAVLEYCRANQNTNEIHIVDLGCGGGDCITYLSKKLEKSRVKAHFIGIDGNPHSIDYAIKNNPNPKQIDYKVANIIDPAFKVPDCDLLISSHFMYHFDNEGLLVFLKKIESGTIKHVIFSELYRNVIAYYLFKFIRHLLPISHIAKKDGLIAIQRAFSVFELKKIIEDFGIKKFKILKKPFFRLIIKIDL